MAVINLVDRGTRTCNGCVSLYHLGNKVYRCGIFKREELTGHVNPNAIEEGIQVYQPKPCPFYSNGGNSYND